MLTMKHTREWFKANKREILNSLDNTSCCNCGEVENIQLHHIVPLALGGTNHLTNICTICEDCHYKVHGKNVNMTTLAKEGIKRAKERGVIFGRPKKNDEKVIQSIEKYLAGEISNKEVIASLEGIISESTFYRRLKEYKKELATV